MKINIYLEKKILNKINQFSTNYYFQNLTDSGHINKINPLMFYFRNYNILGNNNNRLTLTDQETNYLIKKTDLSQINILGQDSLMCILAETDSNFLFNKNQITYLMKNSNLDLYDVKQKNSLYYAINNTKNKFIIDYLFLNSPANPEYNQRTVLPLPILLINIKRTDLLHIFFERNKINKPEKIRPYLNHFENFKMIYKKEIFFDLKNTLLAELEKHLIKQSLKIKKNIMINKL